VLVEELNFWPNPSYFYHLELEQKRKKRSEY